MSESLVWRRCQKRPVVVEYRKVLGDFESIKTPEGLMKANRNVHLIIRGVEGEEYPILGTVFAKTYDVLPEWLQEDYSHEPFWKSDLVGRIWAYARSSGLVVVDSARDDAGRETLPKGLRDLIGEIRSRCDRCGKSVEQAVRDENSGSRMNPITDYQCCHIHTLAEDYTPKLCPACHQELMRIFPHSVISV